MTPVILEMDFTNDINVDGSEDPYYRYKMPPLKVSSISMNGGTTVIVNAENVAKAIYRTAHDLQKCFSRGLACRVTIKNLELHIPGAHT